MQIKQTDKLGDAERVTVDQIAQLRAQVERLQTMLHRICEEGFGYDDTRGGEPFDAYILRQVARLRAASSARN